MSEKQMDLSPRASVYRSYAEKNTPWHILIGELIDNSLDAKASVVTLEFQPNRFTLFDNGVGCPDLERMLALGERHTNDTEGLGRYGVGGKEALLCMGGFGSTVVVSSAHKGTVHEARVRWRDVADGRCPVQSSKEDRGAPAGTSIRVRDCQRQPRSGKPWERLLQKLSYIYSPAIESGREINLRLGASKAKRLQPYADPQFLELVEQTISVNGKAAFVRVGLVAPGVVNSYAGISYSYGYRVVREACADGCGDYSFSRIAGRVSLGPDWILATNKDAITSDDQQALYDAVYDVIEPLLKKGHQQGHEMLAGAVQDSAEQWLNSLIHGHVDGPPNARARRDGPKSKSGTQTPTGKGGKHTRALSEQEGSTFVGRGTAGRVPGGKQSLGRIRIQFDNCEPTAPIGHAEKSLVRLNQNHPWVAPAIGNPSLTPEAATERIMHLAALVLCDFSGKQMLLDGSVTERVGQLFSQLKAFDGQVIGEAAE